MTAADRVLSPRLQRPQSALAGSVALLLILIMVLTSTIDVRASAPPLFSDGFESSDLTAWTTTKGFVVQQALVDAGVWAGRATTSRSAGYASKTLAAPAADVSLGARVNLIASSTEVTLLRLRTGTGAGIVSLKINKGGKLVLRNEVAAITTSSTTVLSKGIWHALSLRALVDGSTSLVEVWLDGSTVGALTGGASLGSTPIGRLQIGNTGLGTMDVAFDDVAGVAPSTVSDQGPPTAPTGLTAVAPSPRAVDLSWSPSTDDVGVTSYTVFRQDVAIATIGGATTTYSDRTVVPDTAYDYAVRANDAAGNGSALSEPASVTTPPGDPLVTAAGDICPATPTNCAGTADLVRFLNPDVAITLGDNQYPDGTLAQYLASYDRTWGSFKGRTRPTTGNHEWNTTNAQGYRDYFGTSVLTNGGTWYSYDLGTWHLVALDSNCSLVGGCGSGSAQYTWLEQDLAADQHPCTLAYWHHPRFSSGADHGGTTTVQPLWDLVATEGGEIVLSGHEHNYERFAPQTGAGTASMTGIRQFVVGTGGAAFYGFATAQPNSEVQIANTRGVLELTLADAEYGWRFVDVGGNVLDSGTGACH